jgi:hypothetical protein
VPTLAVGAIVLGLYLGSQALNTLVPEPADGVPRSAGAAVDLGPIQLVLQPGWQLDASSTGAPVISKGSVGITLRSYGVAGDAQALYTAYVNDELATTAKGFAATTGDATLIGGLPAVRGVYNGVFSGGVGQVEGDVTVLVAGDQGYVFDARGAMGTLHPLRGEINDMLDTIMVKQ